MKFTPLTLICRPTDGKTVGRFSSIVHRIPGEFIDRRQSLKPGPRKLSPTFRLWETISSWRRRSTASSKRGCCRHERSPADQPPAPRTARRGSEDAPGSGFVRGCHPPPGGISPFPLDASTRTLMVLPGGTLGETPFSPRNRRLFIPGLQSIRTSPVDRHPIRSKPSPQPTPASHAEHRSAGMSVGRFVFAAGMLGMIEASTTDRPSTPCTLPRESTTAVASAAGPMRQVPAGWKYVPTLLRIADSRSASASVVCGPGNRSWRATSDNGSVLANRRAARMAWIIRGTSPGSVK